MAIHPLQTAAWAQFRQKMGIDVKQLGLSYISFHRIPHTPWTIGYFPKGPLPTKKMVNELRNLGTQQNAIFIQLEPDVLKNSNRPMPNVPALQQSHHPLFTKYTFIIDLTKSQEDLQKSMHPKTRYNIKVAEKHNVKIQENNSDRAFETYIQLSRETTDRQGYYAHNELYQRTMWNSMHNANIARLWTATYEGIILAAWIVFIHDNVMYYPYGASSREHREVMAPNLLLWELIKWGKQQKLRAFDLWGALGPSPTGEPDPHDPWYGFHRFKAGYAPMLVEYAGSYDLIIQPFLYGIYCIADSIRWSVLKLLK
jgi:lipid II:glycine glycyltransferase (peptidoglycan interpeptide bridge formation enzyme)